MSTYKNSSLLLIYEIVNTLYVKRALITYANCKCHALRPTALGAVGNSSDKYMLLFPLHCSDWGTRV